MPKIRSPASPGVVHIRRELLVHVGRESPVHCKARTDTVIVTNNAGISALQVSVGGDGMPSLHPLWQNAAGGTSPIVANGVIYYAGAGVIHALDAATGNELWHDGIGSIHWESPIVVNGVLYITDGRGNLTAYGTTR